MNKPFAPLFDKVRDLVWDIRNGYRNALRWLERLLLIQGLYRFTKPVKKFAFDIARIIRGPKETLFIYHSNPKKQWYQNKMDGLLNFPHEPWGLPGGIFATIRTFIDSGLTWAPSDYYPAIVRFPIGIIYSPIRLVFFLLKVFFFYVYLPLGALQYYFIYTLRIIYTIFLFVTHLNLFWKETLNNLIYWLRSLVAFMWLVLWAPFTFPYGKSAHTLRPYIYILPAVSVLAVFTFFPIINTFILSFFDNYDYLTHKLLMSKGIVGFADYWNFTTVYELTNEYTGWTKTYQISTGLGFLNYTKVLESPLFWDSIKNTFLMAFVSVPLAVIVALLISVGLNSIKRFQGFLQTVFFLPYVTNVIAIGLVFTVMFNTGNGVINYVLSLFGIDPVTWISIGASYESVVTTMIIYTVWSALAFKIMVFLAGIQGIDKQYYQAAKVDATPKWRVFLRITVPLLSPMIAYVTITSFIGGFKSYASVVSMLGEDMGPPGNSRMLVTIVGFIFYSFQNSNTIGQLSQAAAGAVLLFLLILTFTTLQMYVSKKRVHY